MSGLPTDLTVDNFDERLESAVEAYETARLSTDTRYVRDLEHLWRRLAFALERGGSAGTLALEHRFAVAMVEAISAMRRPAGAS